MRRSSPIRRHEAGEGAKRHAPAGPTAKRRVLAGVVALGLATVAVRDAGAAYLPDRIIVKYRSGTSAAKRGATCASLHARPALDLSIIGAELLQLDGTTVDAALANARRDPAVEYAEPDYEVAVTVFPNDPLFPDLYALHNTGQFNGVPGADIQAPEAWDVFTGDPNVKVGIIDTGIDANHPDLAANVWTNPG